MKVTFPLRSQAMHIVIVMHDFSTGGSERIAIRLANQWARSGRKVSILCGVAEGPARCLVDPLVSVIGVWPAVARGWMSRLVFASSAADCVALLEPDIVFAPGNFHIPVIGTMARMLGAQRPVMILKLSNPLRRPGRSAIVQRVFELLTRRATAPIDAFVAMSSSLAAEARSALHRDQVCRIHEPNIDAAGGAVRHRTAPGRTTILCAGRLVHQKNFTLAIEAFARLDRRFDARLLILGEGHRRTALEVAVDRLGLNDRVSFAGYVPDIRPALAQASLFLLSSHYEGYPAVLIEALAAGVPAVTTDCSPALAEIMTDPAFGQIARADPDALARAMEAVLDQRDAGIDASALIERHSLDRVAGEYLALFDRTLETRRAAVADLTSARAVQT